jgi:signal transduction histidine kinase
VHPSVLDDLGLAAALGRLARAAAGDDGRRRVGVVVTGVPAQLPPAVAATLYRVAEEALGNVLRHAGATRVRVGLAVEPALARLEVSDDGRGFTTPPADAAGPTSGLFVLRERAALLDGRLHVASTPGRGTRVRAELPLPHPAYPPAAPAPAGATA